MSTNIFNRLASSAQKSVRQCIERFPVTIVFVVLLSLYCCHQVYLSSCCGDKDFLIALGYFLSLGTLLSFSLHLWSDEVSRPKLKKIVWAMGYAALLVDSCYIYSINASSTWNTEITLAHAAFVFALTMSVFFVSFFREKNDVSSWNFVLQLFCHYIIAQFIVGLFYAGVSILLASLNGLFNVVVDYKVYEYIMCIMIIPSALLFLGRLPRREQMHNPKVILSEFWPKVVKFVFLPLTGAYLAVLYIYALRILVSWELPDGWCSWLVVVLMIMCIGIEITIYPARQSQERKFENRLSWLLPLLVLPLLILMSVGIVRRLSDYGMTVSRLYLLILNLWFYAVCIGLIIGKAKRINWIPISFAATFLLVSVLPVNISSVWKHYVISRVEAAIEAYAPDTLPMKEVNTYKAWLKQMPKAEADNLNDNIRTMRNDGGKAALAQWIDPAMPSYWGWEDNNTVAVETEEYEYYNIDGELKKVEMIYEWDADDYIDIPQGYSRMMRKSLTAMDDMPAIDIDNLSTEEDSVTVRFSQYADTERAEKDNVGARLSVADLMAVAKGEKKVMKPIALEGRDGVLVLTSFGIGQYARDGEQHQRIVYMWGMVFCN